MFSSSDEDKPQSIYTAHLIASYLSVTPLLSSICSNLSARLGLVVALLGLWSLVEGRAPRKGRVRQQVDHFPVNIGFVSLSNIQSRDSTHFDKTVIAGCAKGREQAAAGPASGQGTKGSRAT